jgi:hypothetical protein
MCSVIGYQQAFALKFSERSRGFYRANRDRLHLNEGTEAANDAIVISLDIFCKLNNGAQPNWYDAVGWISVYSKASLMSECHYCNWFRFPRQKVR